MDPYWSPICIHVHPYVQIYTKITFQHIFFENLQMSIRTHSMRQIRSYCHPRQKIHRFRGWFILLYFIHYIIHDPGFRVHGPPPQGEGWDGFLLKLMISVRNPCYGAAPGRFSSGGALEGGLLTQISIFLKGSVCHMVSYSRIL